MEPFAALLALLMFAAFSCVAPGRPTSSRQVESPWAQLDAVAASEQDHQALVGLAVGVAVRGEVVFVKGYGFEDREAEIPVNPRATQFRWASVSKTLTAVLLEQLARERLVDWTAPTTRYVPEYAPRTYLENGVVQPLPEAQQSLSLLAVAGHLAGIAHYHNGLGSPEPPNPTGLTMEQSLATLATKPLVGLPGKYSYSTFGFILLGVVIEKAAHATFDAVIDARINAKLGTKIVVDHELAPIAHRAVGYMMKDGVITREGSTDVSWKAAGGGLISTVEDLTRYCAALDGDKLLTAEGKQRVWTSQRNSAGWLTGYGAGFSVATRGRERWVGHTGEQEKTRTSLDYYPDRHLCVVVMTNSEYANMGRLASLLDRIALALVQGQSQ